MKPEDINRAIAEHLGWRIAHRVVAKMPISYFLKPGQQDSDEAALDDCGECPPDYCADLNAMHEAEKALTNEQLDVYCNILHKPHHGVYWAIHATATQRAEAFLRTIGKRRDE